MEKNKAVFYCIFQLYFLKLNGTVLVIEKKWLPNFNFEKTILAFSNT